MVNMDVILNQIYQLRGELEKISVRGYENVMSAATCFLLCGDVIDKLQKESQGEGKHGEGNREAS